MSCDVRPRSQTARDPRVRGGHTPQPGCVTDIRVLFFSCFCLGLAATTESLFQAAAGVMGTPTKPGAPINAHMATVIQHREGIQESNTLYGSPSGQSAHALAKRKNLTKMLAKRMQQEHGADAVRVALIQGELDNFGPLQRGDALTPRDLALLESNVKRAVQACSVDTRDIMPAERWPRPKQGGREGARDFARDLSHVADWTTVSKFKMNFYGGALQREVA